MLATRRNLMAAVAVLPIAAWQPPAIAASLAATDTEWDRLCAAYDRAMKVMVQAMQEFNRQERAWAASGGFAEPKPVEPILTDNAASMTADDLAKLVKSPDWNLRRAAYDAEVKAWNARKRVAENAAIGAAEDAMTEAEGAATLAFVAMRDHRAPSFTALAVKVEYMAERYGDDYEDTEARALVNDIRHLTGREA